jgi:hypothetical protein
LRIIGSDASVPSEVSSGVGNSRSLRPGITDPNLSGVQRDEAVSPFRPADPLGNLFSSSHRT